MVNAQEWLESQEEYNTKEKREQITNLYISNKSLEGELDLTDFTNLEWLHCSDNCFINLNLSKCEKLNKLNCHNNYLTQIPYFPNLEKLTFLNISSNNFPIQDLAIFSKFRSLRELYIANYDKNNISKGIYNHFTGSLEPLKGLSKLRYLDISNTGINTDLECLPESLENFLCSADKRENAKCKEIYNLFVNSEGVVETKHGNITNFSKKLKEYKHLRALGYSDTEIQQLIKLGFELTDHGFIEYLKKVKNLTPEKIKNLTELWKEYTQVQTWLDYNYSAEEKVNLKELNISNKNLWGDLDLKEFKNLENLVCSNNKLINLDISNSLKLKELVCNDNRLVDIIFPLDSEKLVLERINMTNNKELDYATIESRFLKSLPVLVKSKVEEMDKKDLEQIIQERLNIYGEIKDIQYFSTWWNPNCVLATNKVVWYAVRLVVYEHLTEEQKKKKDELENQLLTTQQELAIKKSEVTTLRNNIYNMKQQIAEKNKKLEKLKKNASEEINTIDLTEEQEKIQLVKETKDKEKELKNLNKQINNYQMKTEELEAKIKEILTNEIKVIKVSEHIYKAKAEQKVQELKEKLDGNSPILTIYPEGSGFSISEVMQRTVIKGKDLKKIEQEPNNYLKPTDLVWRTMKGMPGCYHVAVYLGNKRVVHIGSSKFVKTSKVKDSKSLLGARVDNWVDFLHDTDKLIRYHPVIPFQRPAKIQEHITKAVLAEYGAESYSFLGNNCEHFATLVVCGIPFSTQADKISLLVHKLQWDLAKEMLKSEQEFAQMSDSEKFAEELTKNKEYRVKELNDLKTKTELNEEEQHQLTKLEAELEDLEKLTQQFQEQINIGDTTSELSFSTGSHYYGSTTSLLSSTSSTSSINWNQIITKKANIPGTIEQIIPLENNQALVINKVFLYAIRLFEYNPRSDKLTELKRYAKNKLGYVTLENALTKAERVKETEKWKNIHPNFTKELIRQWQSHNFTLEQCQDWINTGLKPVDTDFATWLRDIKSVNAEWLLNHGQEQDLQTEYQEYLNNQTQTNIEIPPK